MDTNLIVVAVLLLVPIGYWVVLLLVPIGYWVYLNEWAEAKAKAEADERAARG